MSVVRLLRPLPRPLARALSTLILLAWIGQIGLLVHRSFLEAAPMLASDLARFGPRAQWKGVYYRGEKLGYLVGQTRPTEDGFELIEEGRLQMLLLGARTAARIRTAARVDRSFALRSFAFTLDPGTGPISVSGTIEGRRLELTVATPSGARTETRDLAEPPSLSLNLPRRLAAEGLVPGKRFEVAVFDPATMKNAPMVVEVKAREVVWAARRPVPAFRVESTFAGIAATSWVTDVGEVVREESPMGLIVVRESYERATALGVPGEIQEDLLRGAAVVPEGRVRIDEPTAVEVLKLRVGGFDLAGPDLRGAGQTVSGDVVELRSARGLAPGPRDPDASRHLAPEPLLEADAPEIVAEARKAVGETAAPRVRAERLVRHVNALLEKKPTLSIPSALEVLRTRVGDCNEHTALFVALARAAGLPARVAVGLVHLHGAFYYHAWAEVYLEEAGGGLWLPVDPTLDQFPADATHLRLARGGLDRQAAILPALGRLKLAILEMKAQPAPILVGRPATDTRPIAIEIPRRQGRHGCWKRPTL